MRTAMVIAAREVREKARLFVVCAAFAILPFAGALLPTSRGHETEVIAVFGGYLAAALGLGIAATLGGSAVVRDLVERRLSFYFTKPVGAASIWFGKAAASILVSIACFAIIAVPAMLAAPRKWSAQWLGGAMPVAGMLAVIVVLFLVSHALGTMVRSRSPLLGLDFVLLVIAAAVLHLILRPLVLAMALEVARAVLIGVGIALVLVLAVAPVWQLANGRSDIRRSHAALMRFLWPAVAIVLFLAGAFVLWLLRVTPGEVTVAQIDQPGHGPLMLMSGKANHRGDFYPTFLVDRAAGTVSRLTAVAGWGPQVSEDGKVAMWLKPVGIFVPSSFELVSTKGSTGIPITPAFSWVMSPDGSRVATVNGQLVSIYDLATGRLLGSGAGLDGRSRHQMFFVSPDVVRILEHRPSRDAESPLRIFELDVRSRSMKKTGERMIASARMSMSVSRADASRMFVPTANAILDARTGAAVATIPGDVTNAAMLYDGRVAAIVRAGAARQLQLHDRDGALRYAVPLPGFGLATIVGETDNGRLLILGRSGVRPGEAATRQHGQAMIIVDLATGAVERKVDGVRGPLSQWTPDPRLMRYASRQDFAAVDRDGRLVAWSLARPEPRALLR